MRTSPVMTPDNVTQRWSGQKWITARLALVHPDSEEDELNNGFHVSIKSPALEKQLQESHFSWRDVFKPDWSTVRTRETSTKTLFVQVRQNKNSLDIKWIYVLKGKKRQTSKAQRTLSSHWPWRGQWIIIRLLYCELNWESRGSGNSKERRMWRILKKILQNRKLQKKSEGGATSHWKQNTNQIFTGETGWKSPGKCDTNLLKITPVCYSAITEHNPVRGSEELTES